MRKRNKLHSYGIYHRNSLGKWELHRTVQGEQPPRNTSKGDTKYRPHFVRS